MVRPAVFSLPVILSVLKGALFLSIVLIPGGVGGFQYLRSAELFDPDSSAIMSTGSMLEARQVSGGNAGIVLSNGKVLIAGGYNGASLQTAELYDPGSGTFSSTGAMHSARWNPTATLLQNGKVLIAGGYNQRDG